MSSFFRGVFFWGTLEVWRNEDDMSWMDDLLDFERLILLILLLFFLPNTLFACERGDLLFGSLCFTGPPSPLLILLL